MEELVQALSKKGALDLLKRLSEGRLRFSEILQTVKNPKTLTRRLRELSSLGLIGRRSGYYVITDRGLRLLRSMEDLESAFEEGRRWLREDNLERVAYPWLRPLLKRYCELLIRRYRDRLFSVVVFGSVARGAADPERSDLDLLVVVDGWDLVNVFLRIEEFMAVRSELRESPEYVSASSVGAHLAIREYPLSRREAEAFHRVYLDMSLDRITLYDREGFFEERMRSLRARLQALGSYRVQLPEGSWYWVLKPDLKAGEVVEL